MAYAINDLAGTEVIAISPVAIDMVSEFYCCNEIAKVEVVHYTIEFTDPNGHTFCTIECDSEIDAVYYANQHFRALL